MASITLKISPKVNPEFTFKKESFSDIMFELPEIFDMYEAEAENKNDEKLDIDWEKYLSLERQGSLHVQAVRKNSRLIGICIGMITPSLRYRTKLVGYADILFVLPEFRKGTGVGTKLIEEYENMLKELGVWKSIASVNCGPLVTLLKWFQYKPSEEVLLKKLG